MSAVTVPLRQHARNTAFAAVLCVVLGAAALTWAEVVDRLRDPAPIEVTGSTSAIVWSNRVFRSEIELARWLRARGVSYEQWVKKHPAAVAILRARGRAATRPSGAATKDAAARLQGRSTKEAPASARTGTPEVQAAMERLPGVTMRDVITPLVVTLGVVLAIGAVLPSSFARRASGSRLGPVLELADRHRIYLLGSAFSIAVGGLVGAAL